MVRRLEEITDSSGSLRPEVIEGLQVAAVNIRSISQFANKVSCIYARLHGDAIDADHGYPAQLATLTSRYTLEVRTSKDPFMLSTFFGIIQEAATDIRSESKDMLGVEVILHNLKQRLAPALTGAMEPENVVQGKVAN